MNDIIKLYKKAIAKIAWNYYRHPAVRFDASIEYDDLVQEVNIAWWRAFTTLNTTKASLSTHFHTVANNHMKNYTRDIMRNSNTPTFVPLDEAQREEAPDLLGEMERNEAIVAIVEQNLSERDAQVVLMHFGINTPDKHPVPQDELAEEFGMTQQAISLIIINALKNKDLLEQMQDTFE